MATCKSTQATIRTLGQPCTAYVYGRAVGKGVASRLNMNAAHRGGAADLVMVNLASGVLFVAHFAVLPAQHEGPCTAYLSFSGCWVWLRTCIAFLFHNLALPARLCQPA